MQQAMNLKEAGRYTGLSPHTLRFYARTGRLSFYKVGRRLIFDKADIDGFLRANRVPAKYEQGR